MNEQSHVNPPVSSAPTSAETAQESSLAETQPTETPQSPAKRPSKSPRKQPSMAQIMESDEFSSYMSGADNLEKHALISGTVMQVDENTGEVLVDIGSKSEGIIYKNESGDEPIEVGATIDVVVIDKENDDGHPVLSKRRADFERLWLDLQQAKDENRNMEATVSRDVKGGIIVDLGVPAFVPASHVSGRGRSLKQMVGRTVPVRILELNRRKDKVIASHRIAVEEERATREAEVWNSLEKDKVVEGTVRRITDFGAFVDLGGLDGLLHVREMAWSRVDHPENIVKKGQKLQLLVLDLDEERKRVALGLKQLQSDPWKTAGQKYRSGQVVTGKVTHLADTCAFVELEDGIEAIIPVSEISEEHTKVPSEVLSVGQQVEGRIKQVQAGQRRMTVSLRAAVKEKEQTDTRSAIREVNQRASSDDGVRLGDLFGEQLREARDRVRDRKKTRDTAKRRAIDAAEEEEEWTGAAPAARAAKHNDDIDDGADDEVLPDVADDADVEVAVPAAGGQLQNSLADQLKAALAAAQANKKDGE